MSVLFHPYLCGRNAAEWLINMDKTNEKHFGLRVDGEILAKFRYVCGFEGRSANAQIIQLMLKFIADYEKEHEKIQLD